MNEWGCNWYWELTHLPYFIIQILSSLLFNFSGIWAPSSISNFTFCKLCPLHDSCARQIELVYVTFWIHCNIPYFIPLIANLSFIHLLHTIFRASLLYYCLFYLIMYLEDNISLIPNIPHCNLSILSRTKNEQRKYLGK